MWDYDSLYAKALEYFQRARRHIGGDDWEDAIWSLLGLEFLLRLPLAYIHPSLLAAPDGQAILQANGISVPSGSNIQSIQMKTVLLRLPAIVQDFTTERRDDAAFLVALRNEELHTGSMALENATRQTWLPKLIRVGEVIAAHLDFELSDLLGHDVVQEGRALADAEDKKLAREISARIAQAKAFYDRLTAEERESRRLNGMVFGRSETCPACGSDASISATKVRVTGETLDGDSIVQEVVYVLTGCECPVCGLDLTTTAECVAGGLSQQFVEREVESLADRFLSGAYEPDYGND